MKSETEEEIYTFNEHKHRYALWTAARAVQRGFAKTEPVCAALNATTIRRFAESEIPVAQTVFDKQHAEWCHVLIDHFVNEQVKCSYGRAAKMVAIYLKTSVILPTQGLGVNALVIHPPIDRILLQRLAKELDLPALRTENWTTFEEGRYNDIKESIIQKGAGFNWQLEAFWQCNKANE